jgi:cob(I)alamin adenosyltransferase
MPIYTRKGDDGTTGLLGKKRAKKTDPLLEAIGTVDELNSMLGICISLITDKKLLTIRDDLKLVQDRLFSIGSNLAKPEEATDVIVPQKPTQEDINNLEKQIDKIDKIIPPLTNFILPGGHPVAAHLQLARSICRRAERRLFNIETDPVKQKYINRLSDYLFTLSRLANFQTNNTEAIWKS